MSDWGSGNYPIESCPKCKKKAGYTWTWGKNDGHSKGYSTCTGRNTEVRVFLQSV